MNNITLNKQSWNEIKAMEGEYDPDITFVYKLFCPIAKKIRWIGMTSDLYHRHSTHIYGDKIYNLERRKWIENLKSHDLAPIISIIDRFDNKEKAIAFEKEMINKYSAILFNIKDNIRGGVRFIDIAKYPPANFKKQTKN